MFAFRVKYICVVYVRVAVAATATAAAGIWVVLRWSSVFDAARTKRKWWVFGGMERAGRLVVNMSFRGPFETGFCTAGILFLLCVDVECNTVIRREGMT